MVDVATAKHHGVCPECEGYGGGFDADGDGIDCPDEECLGSCPQCWCPGCHDGQSGPPDVDPEERPGSWAAYEHVQSSPSLTPLPGQSALTVPRESRPADWPANDWPPEEWKCDG